MATGKRSFLLYTDVHHTVKKLTDPQAGQLFKHILSYVNDENPITDDFIIELAFEPIKQSLKRDLKHYEEIIEERTLSGRLGGLRSGEVRRLKKEANEANEANALKSKQTKQTKQNEANEAVNVSVSVNDNVNKKRKIKKEFIPPSLEEVLNFFKERGYESQTAIKAFNHYDLANWHDTNGKPVINWKQKMNTNWFKDESKVNNRKPTMPA